MALELRTDNPFTTTGLITVFEDGTSSLDRYALNYVPSVEDKVHTVRDFDTLWDISYDTYGNSKYWWVIQDVNGLENAFDLTVGQTLILPSKSTLKGVLL